MIIDLHTHLIPGVDDGAQSIEDSLNLARQAVAEGVEHLVLTPHHYNGRYVNHAKGVVEAAEQLQEILDQAGIPLQVYPSQEIRINEDLIDQLLNRDLLSLDDGGKYYLIEFPTASIPDYSQLIISQLINRGITPVIAHPERNHVFAKDLDLFASYIEKGCLGQLTASSITGAFGDYIQEVSCTMVERGLVHILASDAHSVDWRPFNMQAGFRVLEGKFGLNRVTEFKENARSIFNGEEIVRQKIQKKTHKKEKTKKSIFDFFKR